MNYLNQRPMAADSLGGIAYWWLAQQAITRNLDLIEQALEHLVSEGKIAKEEKNDRDVIYHLKVDKQ